MNKKYVIITDSCCDMSPELVKELDIEVIPLQFKLGNETYLNLLDGSEMSFKDFYAHLRNKEVSTTSQPNPTQFLDLFKSYLDQGYDILSISFSSALSGTFSSSCLARDLALEQYKDSKIVCIDSLCASLGQGLLVYYAAKMRQEGKSLDEVALWTEENKLKIIHWFTVDDLGTLKRGGRLSASSAFLGTLLGIKPVLHVSYEGKLVPITKCRGRKNSLLTIIENAKRTIINPEEQVIFISHGDSIEDAEFVGNALKKQLNVKDVYYNYVGPVIGSHSGPGTIALFYVGSSRE